jgi:hypothetical protein
MIHSLKNLFSTRKVLVLAFALEHLWLVWAGVHGVGQPMGDIIFAYHPWVQEMTLNHSVMGITQPWVYPYPDLLFMFLPQWLFPSDYQAAWLVMSGLIDFAAFAVLLFWPRKYDRARVRAGWFWLLAQVLLGPVSISRLDTISIAIAIVGLVAWLRAKPATAAVWFAIATWIKVWPVALLSATIAEAKNWKSAAIWGGITGGALLLWGLVLGGFHNTLSFVLEQTGRGIQIESPWAAPWLWGRIAKFQGWDLYYSDALKTFQVKGPLADQVAALLGPLMYVALLITVGLGWFIIRKGQITEVALRNEVFAWTVLTAVLDMIVFNKVGSPQYYGWLIVPAILGLIERVPDWRIVAYWLIGILGLTGLIYPDIYDHILSSQPWATAILTARNAATVMLLVFTNARLVELALKQLRQKRAN